MKKIAVINDLSGMGKCSLTAAIPVISAMGVQTCPLPTAVLSNQTGYPSYFWDDYTDRMDSIMEEWKKRNLKVDGIYSGFLAGEAQAEKIQKFLDLFSGEDTLILNDPVMGDQGRTYGIYTEGLCRKMRELVKRAHIITPNLTEALLLLCGREKMLAFWEELNKLPAKEYLETVEQIGVKLEEEFSLPALVITGIDYRKEDQTPLIGNLIRENKNTFWKFTPKTGGSYSGTGDLFASVLSAGLVQGLSVNRCVEKAVDFLGKAIADAVEEGTDHNDGVCFETYLHELKED